MLRTKKPNQSIYVNPTVKLWGESYSFRNPTVQKRAIELLSKLVQVYFPKDSDYAIEKFVKTFIEGLIYLESNLLRQRGIHPEQLNLQQINFNPVKGAEKVEKYIEVEKIMFTEINRLFRHYSIIFASIQSLNLKNLKKCN